MTAVPIPPVLLCGLGLVTFAILIAILQGVFRWRFGPALLGAVGLMLLAAAGVWPPLAYGVGPALVYFFAAALIFIAGIVWESALGNPDPCNYPTRGR